MKQIIYHHTNGKVSQKYYLNHLGKFYCLATHYWYNGNLSSKTNYLNDKEIGLDTDYNNKGKINKINYYL